MSVSKLRIENEFRKGIKLWLETRQNQALYSDKSPCETIQELIEDLENCHDLPWETMLPETHPDYKKPAYDEPV